MGKRVGKLGNGWVAVLLACLTAVLLTATAPAIGLTWDEPAYITGADSYAAWFGQLVKDPGAAFQPATIDTYWSANHEHPPVDKVWSGLIWLLAKNVFDDLTANRLGNILLAAVLIGFLYYWVAGRFGTAAGLFAAGALLAMPRFFFHAHLIALDVPVAIAIFLVTFLFWRTIDRREWWWGLVLGLAWGLAEAVKLNATFLPIGLVIWCLAFRRHWYVALRFLLMGITAALTFFLVWPWLYPQPWQRLLEYVHFHIDHFKIGQWYFGHFYTPPPWHFALVMIWAVVPLALLLLAFLGMARAGKGRQDGGLVWLWIISAVVPLLPFVVGRSLAYDNDRLFMPTYPFLAALSSVGFAWLLGWLRKLAERMQRPRLVLPAGLLLAALLFLPEVIAMVGLYPHLLSYYSEGVGGLPGATRLGLETTYWCESYAAALPVINAEAHSGDKIWVEPWSYDVMIYYQLHGQLRRDLTILNTAFGAFSLFGPWAPQPVYGEFFGANWIVFEYRQSQFEEFSGTLPLLPEFLKSLAPPVVDIRSAGVPIMQLYHR